MPFYDLDVAGFTPREDSQYFQSFPMDKTNKFEMTGGFIVARPKFTRAANTTIVTGYSDFPDNYKQQLDTYFLTVGCFQAFTYIYPTSCTGYAFLPTIGRASNVATCVLPGVPTIPLVTGQLATIGGVSSDPTLDAIWTPITVVNTTTFTYASAGANLGAVSAGPFSSVNIGTGTSVMFNEPYKPKYIGAGRTFLWEISAITLRTT